MSKIDELSDATAKKINALASNSTTAKKAFASRLNGLDGELAAAGKTTPAQLPAEYWKFVGLHDALRRVESIVNYDFSKLSDTDFLSTTRFVCEMAMWVRYLENPNNNSFEYYAYLLNEKKRHFARDIEQMKYEVKTMRGFQIMQDDRLRLSAERAATFGMAVPKTDEIEKILESVEAEAGKQFSIYSDYSRGYNFETQADWIESDRLPALVDGLEKVNKQMTEFEAETNYKFINHKWIALARLVKMEQEYEYVYRLTSRMLHATPISLSTELSSLTQSERYIFLQYLLVKFNEIHQITLEVMAAGEWKSRPS